jgi:hypothetical protein
MNRLDPVSSMLVSPPTRSSTSEILRGASWAILIVACGVAVARATSLAYNFPDRLAHVLTDLSIVSILADAWALGLAVFRKSTRTPLRIPTKTPLILGPLHLAIWYWSVYLGSFEVLYGFERLDDLGGVYTLRWDVLLLLILLAGISVVTTVLQTRLVGWVLVSENTAVPEYPVQSESVSEPDMPAGPEHVYEAQVILNNLGYEIGGIDGIVGEPTRQALKRFQESCGLNPTGDVTILTMIELRNRWAGEESPPPGQSLLAVSSHILKRVLLRIPKLWRKKSDS